jgi:hypothetical protein
VTVPTPPAGQPPPNPRDYLGFHPTSREVSASAVAIANLAKGDAFNAALGSLAPPAATLAAALETAIEWRAMRASSEAWDAYVRGQDGLAWKQALTIVDEVKPVFQIAVAKNPALASQYPGLVQLFEAPRLDSKQATATKKKNAKTKAAAALSSAHAAGEAAAATTAPEPAPAAPTATPMKTVTISA